MSPALDAQRVAIITGASGGIGAGLVRRRMLAPGAPFGAVVFAGGR